MAVPLRRLVLRTCYKLWRRSHARAHGLRGLDMHKLNAVAVLEGQTFDGKALRGTDSVRVVP